jgi:peptide deformylase
MAIRQTIQIGHPVLKAKNKPIIDFGSKKLHQVVEDLIDTMHEAQLIGMAAPQIAENFQVFVTEPRETKTRAKDQADTLRIYINPKIIYASKEEVVIFEGCGSVMQGKLFGPVSRPKTITIEAFDLTGKKYQFTTDGILAQVIQHEYDHMEGIEFLEKVSNYKEMMTVDYYVDRIKNDPKHREACVITRKEIAWSTH